MKSSAALALFALCCFSTAYTESYLIGFTHDDPIPTLIVEGEEFYPAEVSVSDDGQELWIAYSVGKDDESMLFPKKTYIGYRNYAVTVTDSEKSDIHFILKTLAQKSLASLWASKSELEHAGERIDHIHPLRFLECIFRDEELKVYMHNIKKRGSWVWSEFIKGFNTSFDEESEIGNLKGEYLEDFTNNLGIKLKDINTPIKKRKWADLVKTLISIIPREGDPGRYDQ